MNARKFASIAGPLAIKFWNYRRFRVRILDAQIYVSSWNNGIFEPSQINWAIPDLTYDQVKDRIDSRRDGYPMDSGFKTRSAPG